MATRTRARALSMVTLLMFAAVLVATPLAATPVAGPDERTVPADEDAGGPHQGDRAVAVPSPAAVRIAERMMPLGSMRETFDAHIRSLAMMAGIALDRGPGGASRAVADGLTTQRIILEESASILAQAEPEVRRAIAAVLTRTYDAQQLAEIEQFVGTATGAAFARTIMQSGTEPEIIEANLAVAAALQQAYPRISERLSAEVSHHSAAEAEAEPVEN